MKRWTDFDASEARRTSLWSWLPVAVALVAVLAYCWMVSTRF
jgi:hypothetical protein